MFSDRLEQPDPSLRLNHKFRKFLSSKFRHEINNLVLDLIGKSNLHFIRCVKSNNLKAPLCMDDEVVYNQICYLGILDTIKLKKIGYCVKVKYSALDRRFQWLFRDNSC
jgi:myosin heavy subunit